MKIEAETMFEKVLQTTQKTIQHRVQLIEGNGKKHPSQFQDSKDLPSRGGGGGHGGHFILVDFI